MAILSDLTWFGPANGVPSQLLPTQWIAFLSHDVPLLHTDHSLPWHLKPLSITHCSAFPATRGTICGFCVTTMNHIMADSFYCSSTPPSFQIGPGSHIQAYLPLQLFHCHAYINEPSQERSARSHSFAGMTQMPNDW